MSIGFFAFNRISCPAAPAWLAAGLGALLAVLFLPVVVWKAVVLGQGDVQVYFRAGWAVWTGYPLYEVADRHGWTYQYPPTFALFMGPFADPLPGYPQPWWALPFAAGVVVWYLINAACMLLCIHLWATALERYRFAQIGGGFLQGSSLLQNSWALRLGPFLALLPFIGVGLERGQPTAIMLLLMVAFLILYVENRLPTASFMLALAISIKIFPVVLTVLPLARRDWKFVVWTTAWCGVLLVGLPMIAIGPGTTLTLYRALWTEHLSGLVTGHMSPSLAEEISPGGYSRVGVGAVVGRIAAGGGFYTSPLPAWTSILQYLFNAGVVAAVIVTGRGGFWNFRGAQRSAGYPFLVAGAIVLAAVPLMIPFGKPQDIAYAVPLVAVFTIEAWRRAGRQIVTAAMIAWTCFAWLSLVVLEVPWNWLKTIGPMTWLLLILGPASYSLLRKLSLNSRGVERQSQPPGGAETEATRAGITAGTQA